MIFNPTIIKKGGGYGAYNLASVVDRTVTEITAEDLEGVTTIGDGAFANCSELTSIEMPSSVSSMGSSSNQDLYFIGVFRNCIKLASVRLSANIEQIYSATFFGCTSLTNLVIPEGIKILGGNGLSGSTVLFGIAGESGIENISLPNSIVQINKRCFSFMKKLISINIPEGIAEISGHLFGYCVKLNTVTLPSTITSIDSHAFSDAASNGLSITIKAITPPILNNTFKNVSITQIYVPAESVEAYKTATNWSTYADKIFAIE